MGKQQKRKGLGDGFVKLVKTKAYFKRFQTKYKRRREGKTDYKARTAMVKQCKNKYNSPKYRFIVRISNSKVVCQVAFSEIIGDRILCHADSAELQKRYGAKVGLKNYAACYATGLLCARRMLTKLGLADKYQGLGDDEANGEVNSCDVDGKTFYVSDVDDDKNPFRCCLDVGIQIVSTGNRVMGALKGAVDGGLDIPHNHKRFPGYDNEAEEGKGSYDAGVHAERIYGEHIGNHMEELDEEEVNKLFADYVKAGVGHEDIKPMWEAVHKAIRADPKAAPKSTKGSNFGGKFKKKGKDSLETRRANSAAKKQAIYDAKAAEKKAEEEDSDDDDDEDEDE